MSERLYLLLKGIAGALDFCMSIMVVQLGMCVIVSFVVLEIVLVLRRTLLKDRIFAKGMLWSVFLLVPFVGKLKLFYTNIYVGRPFIMWLMLCNKIKPVIYVYVLGMLVSVIRIARQNRAVRKVAHDTRKWRYKGDTLYISELTISPFATGILSPRIVLPGMLLDKLNVNELDMVILHEKTHIRLKHLWVYYLWNVLCCLLWPNICLFMSTSMLKEDMEDICDRVTIRRSGDCQMDYGRLIIKSAALINTEINALPATLNGEDSFQAAKRRIIRIRDYVPYRAWKAVVMCAFVVCGCLVSFTAIKAASYPRYTEFDEMTVLDKDFNIIKQAATDEFKGVVEIKASEVIVDNEKLREMYPDMEKDKGVCYISWGGFMKFPGAGGGGDMIWIDELSEGDKTVVPYESNGEDVFCKIVKWF